MRRQLSKQTYDRHLARLKSGVALSDGEFRALIVAVNRKASDAQLIELLNAAMDCRCATSKGILVDFECRSNAFGDMEFMPVFQRPMPKGA